jgi:hypothetical protein
MHGQSALLLILHDAGHYKNNNHAALYENFCSLPDGRCDPWFSRVHWVEDSVAKECQMARPFYVRVARRDQSYQILHASAYVFRMQAFDAMIHFSFEGSFLFLSTFGRQVNTSVGPFAELCAYI